VCCILFHVTIKCNILFQICRSVCLFTGLIKRFADGKAEKSILVIGKKIMKIMYG